MKNVLIADDDPLNQRIFTELLEEDYELSIVEDGEACIESIKQRKPDLLLLDYSMPQLNGLEVCQNLRKDERFQDLPIIIVTGHASQDTHDECIEAGATDFCSKPFELSHFRNMVSKCVSS